MSDKAYEALEETIRCFQPRVQKNLEIVTPESLGQKNVLHIAMSKFQRMVPNVSRRAAYSEDNTVPRVHTSPTLLQCIIGHAGVFIYATHEPPGTKPKDEYKGGFYIHSIPFECAVKPNRRLVYDANDTDEIWLVTYSEETRDFPVESIGCFVVCGIEIEPLAGGRQQHRLNIVVKVPNQTTYKLTNTIELKSGYYRVFVEYDVQQSRYSINHYSEIDKKVYDEERTLRTTLLNYKEKIKNW